MGAGVLMFNWVEYMVFGSMLLLSLLIGVYYGWFSKQNSVAEYMLGGKKMAVFPVTLSMVASHVSGITLLGVPSEIYSYGTQFCALVFVVFAIYLIINYLYLPVFFELQLNSLYEYLELRFSKATRTLASLIFAMSLMVYIPVVIYIPSLAFNQVTGVSVHVIAPTISLICIFYTSFGGLKAVVWTDALQSVFTLGSTVFIVVLGFMRIGSVSEVLRINKEGGRLEFFNLDPSPFSRMTFWGYTVGAVFLWMASLAVNPGAMQRYIAVSSFNKAKSVTFWSCVGFFTINFFVVLIGLLEYATYHDCDPVATKMVQKSGQILPLYVMTVAKDFPGLTGLFISGVLSAALSTMSAGLNTVAGTLYEDFVMYVRRGEPLSEERQNCVTKLVVLVLGLICAALVLVVEKLGALFQMGVSLQGIANGALTGVFTLGLFFPRANHKGAVAGSLASLVLMSVIVFGAQWYTARGLLRYPSKVTSVAGCPANFTHSLGFNASAAVSTYQGVGSPVIADDSVPLIFQISFLFYIAIGTLTVVVVGLVVSYLTEPPEPRCLQHRLFSPPVRRLLPPDTDQYEMVNTGDTKPPPATTKQTNCHSNGTGKLDVILQQDLLCK